MSQWILSVVILYSSLVSARPYKYYLDPRKAEQVLAGINLRPRLADEEWLKLINFDRDKKRQIQSGESLWSIARTGFGDPFLWRKLWQENPWLTNPHELEVGRMLAYYRESEGLNSEKKIPIIKLRPDKSGTLTDVDNDVYVNRVFRARYRLNYLVIKEDDILGEITGSYTPRTQMSVNDEFYVSFFNENKVEPGSKFAVVREERELRDKTQVGEPVIGKMVRFLGEIKVLSNDSKLTKVEMDSQFYPVKREDKIILIPKIGGETNAEFPARDLIAQIVMLDDAEKFFGSQGELVVLNKGVTQGMQEGFLFKVFEDTDPVKNSRGGVVPTSKGEIRVVYAGEDSSVGVINRNTEPLRIGDSLLSFPELPNRPTSPKKQRQEISID